MPSPLPLLVFSDLDGTLLDHDSYDPGPARPALEALARIGAGVVLASSKTAAEVAPIRVQLELARWPAIVENGAGLLPPGPEDAALLAGDDYQMIRARLDRLPSDLRRLFRGFGDMSVAEVARATGLEDNAARRARRRTASEPGLFDGNAAQEQAFCAALRDSGLSARRGGRFLTVGFGQTKAGQMDAIIASLAPRVTVALGDAPNDIEMLDHADYGVIVRNPHAKTLPFLKGEADGRIRRTSATGPEGWNEAILSLLSELGLSEDTAAHG